MSNEKAVTDLVRAASAVLKGFRSGRSPTFDQLDKLEATLTPFTTDKLCGHGVLEECDCAELNGILSVEYVATPKETVEVSSAFFEKLEKARARLTKRKRTKDPAR